MFYFIANHVKCIYYLQYLIHHVKMLKFSTCIYIQIPTRHTHIYKSLSIKTSHIL